MARHIQYIILISLKVELDTSNIKIRVRVPDKKNLFNFRAFLTGTFMRLNKYGAYTLHHFCRASLSLLFEKSKNRLIKKIIYLLLPFLWPNFYNGPLCLIVYMKNFLLKKRIFINIANKIFILYTLRYFKWETYPLSDASQKIISNRLLCTKDTFLSF